MPARRSFPGATVRAGALALAAAMLALLAGCGDNDPDRARSAARLAPPAPGTYAARVPGTDAFLAAALDRDSVAGYLCDRGRTSAWFADRPHRDGHARLVSRTRRATLALTPAADGLRPRVRLPNGTARTVTLARQTGRAGVYRAAAQTRRGGLQAGWIVLQDGSQRGATTQFMQDDIDFGTPLGTTAAPTLDTATGTVKFNTAGTVTATKLTQPGFMEKGLLARDPDPVVDSAVDFRAGRPRPDSRCSALPAGGLCGWAGRPRSSIAGPTRRGSPRDPRERPVAQLSPDGRRLLAADVGTLRCVTGYGHRYRHLLGLARDTLRNLHTGRVLADRRQGFCLRAAAFASRACARDRPRATRAVLGLAPSRARHEPSSSASRSRSPLAPSGRYLLSQTVDPQHRLRQPSGQRRRLDAAARDLAPQLAAARRGRPSRLPRHPDLPVCRRSQEISMHPHHTARRPRRLALLCVGAVAGALALAASAPAAVVRKVPNADFTAFELVYEAGAGERNLVTVDGLPGSIILGDRGPLLARFPAGFAARDGCVFTDISQGEDAIKPFCTRRATQRLKLTLGDDNDRLAFTPQAFPALPDAAVPIDAFGGTGSDVLDASGLSFGLARLSGEEGGDFLTGGIESGRVELDGGPGPDVLIGGPGEEVVSYADRPEGVTVTIDGVADDGDGSDALAGVIGSPRDNVRPGVGLVRGSPAGDSLSGSDADETLEALGGRDTLSGRGGNDRLFASDGERDTILCGPGADDQAVVDLQDLSGDRNARAGAFPDCESVFQAAVDSHPTVQIAKRALLRRGSLHVTLRCPRALTGGCAGRLFVAAGDGPRALAGRRYARIRPGARRVLRLRLRSGRARRARRDGVRLRATALERDRLGRPKRTIGTLGVRADTPTRSKR